MNALVPIRPVRFTDVATLATLHAASFPDEAWSADDLTSLLSMPGGFGLIAFSGTATLPEQAVMTACTAPAEAARGFSLLRVAADEAELLTIAVLPDARRSGLGSRLLAAGMVGAAGGGAVTLFLEVADDNNAARALYQQAGFTKVGRRPGYYHRGARTIDALILSRSLLTLNL
ncbi:MAG: GNAT family N-acetyltransferase [Rhodospirillaceae bacterium]